MQLQDFNAESAAPLYGYERSPVNARAFLIMKKEEGKSTLVGEYTVLDKAEAMSLAEKKMMNLVSLLNRRQRLLHLGEETKSRTLHQIITDSDEDGKTKVIFYKLERAGVSQENALFWFICEEQDALSKGITRPELDEILEKFAGSVEETGFQTDSRAMSAKAASLNHNNAPPPPSTSL